MSRKLKFKPVITRVKLNPEQAVLTCACYHSNIRCVGAGNHPWTSVHALSNGAYWVCCHGKSGGHGAIGHPTSAHAQSGAGASS